MKDKSEKKITTTQVLKVIIAIHTCIMVGLIIMTIYGWATGSDNNYAVFATNAAPYCAMIALYEEEKKKEAKKQET